MIENELKEVNELKSINELKDVNELKYENEFKDVNELKNELKPETENELKDEKVKSKININELLNLKNDIQELPKEHHIEIATILNDNNVYLNENNNGIFVNLSIIPDYMIIKLKNYIEFVKNQTKMINIQENRKQTIENKYFKSIKE